MWPLNKRHIRNSENVTNTAVFNNLGALAMTTATSRRTSKKQQVLVLAKQQPFLHISSSLLHNYDLKKPNFIFYGGRKQAMTSLDLVPRNSTPIGLLTFILTKMEQLR